MTVEDVSVIPLGYSPSGDGPPEGSARTRLYVQKELTRKPLWSGISKT